MYKTQTKPHRHAVTPRQQQRQSNDAPSPWRGHERTRRARAWAAALCSSLPLPSRGDVVRDDEKDRERGQRGARGGGGKWKRKRWLHDGAVNLAGEASDVRSSTSGRRRQITPSFFAGDFRLSDKQKNLCTYSIMVVHSSAFVRSESVTTHYRWQKRKIQEKCPVLCRTYECGYQTLPLARL